MRSFFRLRRSCLKPPSDPKFFSATAKFGAREFASSAYPTKVPARRRWTFFIVTVACGVLAYYEYTAYNKWKYDQVLNPTDFTPFILVRKECVSSTSSIFTLQPNLTAKNSRIYADAWEKSVWSIQVKQPQLQIARSYTPLPPIDVNESTTDGAIRFLIRKDPKGEVSGYLHKLPLGATIELRGPHIEYELPEEVQEVLFIAGGTGIAPALQIAHALFERSRESPRRNPKMRILWANRRREDCLGGTSDIPEVETPMEAPDMEQMAEPRPMKDLVAYTSPQTALVTQLDRLRAKSPGNIGIQYFADEDNNFITKDYLRLFLDDPWLDYANALEKMGFDYQKKRWTNRYPPGSRLVLIAGPDGFVRHYAGPKGWKDGREVQGHLGGMLKDIDPKGWAVHKL